MPQSQSQWRKQPGSRPGRCHGRSQKFDHERSTDRSGGPGPGTLDTTAVSPPLRCRNAVASVLPSVGCRLEPQDIAKKATNAETGDQPHGTPSSTTAGKFRSRTSLERRRKNNSSGRRHFDDWFNGRRGRTSVERGGSQTGDRGSDRHQPASPIKLAKEPRTNKLPNWR